MKTLLLLLFTTIAFAQGHIYFGAGLDVRNATFGSTPTQNKSAMDLMLKYGMISDNRIECTINYETFPKIGFKKFSFGVGIGIPITPKITIVPTIEPTLIDRNWSVQYGNSINGGQSSHLSIGFSMPIRVELNDKFDLEVLTNGLVRTDLKAKYGDSKTVISTYVMIIYKLDLN